MSISLLANGADGISDIEGKAVTGSGEQAGTRASFKRAGANESILSSLDLTFSLLQKRYTKRLIDILLRDHLFCNLRS
jgi:hypothetical protein